MEWKRKRLSQIMDDSETIKKQVSKHFDHLNANIEKKTEKHLKKLKRKGKIMNKKK